MWEEIILRLLGVLTGILCLTTQISGQISESLIRDKDTATSLSPTSCILNTRNPNPLNPRTFFHCTTTGSILMKCPEEMVFEAESSTCIKGDAPISDQYAPNCARAINGAFFPSYTYCSHFWRCNFQRALLFECRDGTYWKQEDLACVYPEDANCHLNEDDKRIGKELYRSWKRPTLKQMRKISKYTGTY